ncbi:MULTISPECIES: DMT family transporter [Methanosarcina]|jgi:drug/metabolite transporter (DMT)-like permease|uniref:Transporter n=8 Tax=Methanosarcina mazei TaxID=2209 RepID=A0A0F8P1U2_METMZ|nr:MULTISPECIES: EamA family transporter [Methanosarcina]AAM29784.1 Transporter [Methanosarcina mazei Go1]AGF95554.1 integral membrane protein [Methanosarcina mazei Tuc01]AKB40206.1 integral membrane protein [Methanosarcina mazei WWM610]AKB61126.1 integral membrane protein [Methanosarcina mazei SarPi]AKB64438.1 integral membrane protein [Methanosarcina mazei S-6]
MQKRAYLLIAVSGSLWGTIGIFVRELYGLGFSTLQIVTMRVFSAAVIMLLYLLFTKPELLKIRFRDSLYFVGTGILSIVFFNLCYFITIRETSIAIAVTLLYTAPAFVAILSRIIFRESLDAKKLFSLGLTLTGCAFVTGYLPELGNSPSITLPWLLTGLGAGFGYALYSIFGKVALKKYDTVTITAYTFFFASLALLPLVSFETSGEAFSTGSFWTYLIGLGFFPTVLAYLLYTKGLEEVESSRAAIVATVEPVVATFAGFFFFREIVSGWQLAGILFVLAGVVLIQERK